MVDLSELLRVIQEVYSQHADDLCWMPADVNKIFVAAGLPPQDLTIDDPYAMVRNCVRYISCLKSGGTWKSYAALEEENRELREQLNIAKLKAAILEGSIRGCPQCEQLKPWGQHLINLCNDCVKENIDKEMSRVASRCS